MGKKRIVTCKHEKKKKKNNWKHFTLHSVERLCFEDLRTLFSRVQSLFILCREINYKVVWFSCKEENLFIIISVLVCCLIIFCTINTLFSLQKDCFFFNTLGQHLWCIWQARKRHPEDYGSLQFIYYSIY